MISERSCDTEDWTLKIQGFRHREKNTSSLYLKVKKLFIFYMGQYYSKVPFGVL